MVGTAHLDHSPNNILIADDSDHVLVRSTLDDRSISDTERTCPSVPEPCNQHRGATEFERVTSTPVIPAERQLVSAEDHRTPTEIQGRISHLERNDERPPRNVYRTLSCIVLGLLFGIPVAMVSIVLGMVSFSFAVIGFAALSRLLSPYAFLHGVWSIVELIVMGGIGRTDTIPIYRGLVETRSGQEYQFSFFGPLATGNLLVGHHVRLTGQSRNGTLMATRGYNETVRSAITSQFRDYWRPFFFVTLLLLLVVIVVLTYMYFNHHGFLRWPLV